MVYTLSKMYIGDQLLEEATVVEAEEPSDINWMTQGYLTGKMPLGDSDLDWQNRPGSKNKLLTKRCKNFSSYIIAGFILIILVREEEERRRRERRTNSNNVGNSCTKTKN